jgi:cobalt/nickel transport system permease protein
MLFAVHISDGVLTAPWWLGGYVAAALLLGLSAWRVRDEEIPRISLLTAAFFVVSLIHVRVGPTSVHLLMNGLVGIVLGPRAALAIFCGLFLQYCFVSHGGLQSLGVNSCVMTFPALLTWLLFRGSQRVPWLPLPFFRTLLVMVSAVTWILGLTFCAALLWDNSLTDVASLKMDAAWACTIHPVTLAIATAGGLAAAWAERWLENAPEFPLGLLLGELAVLASVGLNCAVLILGGEQYWPVPPLVLLVAHLPIAILEGVVLGFTLGFLAKVKPELLGMAAPRVVTAAPRTAESLAASHSP